MCCSQCQGIEAFFDDKTAQRELKQYRKRGPRKTTRLLLDAVRQHLTTRGRLLDIGGGVGAIQHELVPTAMDAVVSVDAAPSYLVAAQQEAGRRGYAEQAQYRQGNFVDLADDLPDADVVTLDRVICCFDDMRGLVHHSARKARQLYAVVFPRDHWWNRLTFPLINLISRLQRSDFRVFLHPTPLVEAAITQEGHHLVYYGQTPLWQVRVYSRLRP